MSGSKTVARKQTAKPGSARPVISTISIQDQLSKIKRPVSSMAPKVLKSSKTQVGKRKKSSVSQTSIRLANQPINFKSSMQTFRPATSSIGVSMSSTARGNPPLSQANPTHQVLDRSPIRMRRVEDYSQVLSRLVVNGSTSSRSQAHAHSSRTLPNAPTISNQINKVPHKQKQLIQQHNYFNQPTRHLKIGLEDYKKY